MPEYNGGLEKYFPTIVFTLLALVLAYLVYSLCKRFFPFKRSFSDFRASVGGGKGARESKPALLILGQCNSGKTRLFYLLQGIGNVDTVTSIQSNAVRFGDLNEKSPISNLNLKPDTELIDFPGHRRLMPQLQPLLKRAWRLIFVLDATDLGALKLAAEQLYDLFVYFENSIRVSESAVPILITATKSDKPTARSCEFLTELLERELERLRLARAAALIEGSNSQFIGVEGKPLKFKDVSSVTIEVCSVSLKNDQLPEPIYTFIAAP